MKKKPVVFVAVLLIGATILLCGFWLGKRSSPLDGYAGYRVYTRKAPFSVIVNGSFPENGYSGFLVDNSPFSFGLKHTKDNTSTGDLGVGTELSIYVTTDLKGHPREMVCKLDVDGEQWQFLYDFNLDGKWDMKVLPKESKRYIYVNNVWVLTERMKSEEGSRVAIGIDGANFSFDRKAKEWKKIEDH